MVFHSDQGFQQSSISHLYLPKSHNIVSSMSRRVNCYENAVADSFFYLQKHEKIQGNIHKSREEAKSETFEYVELFYNSKSIISQVNDFVDIFGKS